MGIRRKLRHFRRDWGFIGNLCRDRIRPWILDTPAIATEPKGTAEVHILTSKHDLPNLFWSLKTFYHYAERAYPLVVHEDGSFGSEDAGLVAQHFPNARIVSRPEADARLDPLLERLPLCREYRRTNPLALKSFDVGEFLGASRAILLDTDILFFTPPEELTRRADDESFLGNAFNADFQNAYTIEIEDVKTHLGFDLLERINTGVAVVQRETFNLDRFESFLACPAFRQEKHPPHVEQTLIALAASRLGAELLGPEYAVAMKGSTRGLVCKHYFSPIRGRMYAEGMVRLWRSGFLEQLGARSTVRS